MVCLQFVVLSSVLLHLCTSVHSANIFFFYGGGTYSHKHAIWPLPSALADLGHNITFFSPHSRRPWTHPNIKDIVPEKLEKLLSVFHVSDKLQMRLAGEERMVWNTLSQWSIDICTTVLGDDDPVVRSIINDSKFDLVFINAAFGECAYIMAEKWGAKVILVDSTSILPWFHDMLGLTVEDNWVPDISSQFMYRMSFLDRLQNFFYSVMSTYDRRTNLYPVLEKMMTDHLRVKDLKPFSEIEREKTDLVMLNTHYSTDFARALPPNFVHVGGLQIWDSRVEKIPTDLQQFMDAAEDGVILMVLGTSYDISKTNKVFLDMFFSMVKAFPRVHFVFSWEKQIPADVPRNLKLSKWLPQKEILGHPKMKGFISHCGLYSMAEATYHGVPIIGLPLVADEDYDAYRIEMEQIGVRLEVKTLTVEQLVWSINEILTNNKYKRNMEKLSKITRERPMNPIDVALWWTDFVLRHDDLSSLRPRTEHLSWLQLRNMDVHAFLLTAMAVSSFLIIKTVHCVVRIFLPK